MKPKTETLTGRPSDATLDSLRLCLHWLDECKKLGWPDDSMPELENLWWQYHNKDGNRVKK